LRGRAGSAFWCVAFSPEGQRLAAGDANGNVRLWNRHQLDTNPDVLSGHDGSVLSVAFSPDGHMLASASGDKTVRIWNLTGDPGPIVLADHEGWVWDVAFSGDGRKLASCSADKTVRIRTTQTGILAERVCEAVLRPDLTTAEWDTLVGANVPYQATCDSLLSAGKP